MKRKPRVVIEGADIPERAGFFLITASSDGSQAVVYISK